MMCSSEIMSLISAPLRAGRISERVIPKEAAGKLSTISKRRKFEVRPRQGRSARATEHVHLISETILASEF